MIQVANRKKIGRDFIALVLLTAAAAAFYGLTYNRSDYRFYLRADEGLNFSAAVRVSQGSLPQRDFSYSYGPLMPMLYASGFRAFGTSLATLRALWAVLYILSIGLFFIISRGMLPLLPAACGSMLLIGQLHTPLYSYNHIGLVLVLQLALLAAFPLLKTVLTWQRGATLSILFLFALLIKFNEAVVSFLMLAVSVSIARLIKDRSSPEHRHEWKSLTWRLVVAGGVAFALFAGVTALLNQGLTREQFGRNFPVSPEYWFSIGGYRFVADVFRAAISTPWNSDNAWRLYSIWYELYLLPMTVAFVVGIVLIYYACRIGLKSRKNPQQFENSWPVLIMIAVAAGLYHEFYLTGNHWSTPMYAGFGIIAAVCAFWNEARKMPRMRAVVLVSCVCVMIVSDVIYIRVAQTRFSEYHFGSDRANIFSSIDSDAAVVQDVVEFLETSTPADAAFAAFPYDTSLIHLAGRKCAMRDENYQYGFFPNEASDAGVVKELQSSRVKRVLVSDFTAVRMGQPVVFGVDYLPRAFAYIQENFHEVKRFARDGVAYQVVYLERNDAAPSEVAARQ